MSVVQVAARMRVRARSRAAAAPRTFWLVLIPVGVLLGLGLMMILSSSSVVAIRSYGSAFPFFFRQLVWAAFGVAVLVLFARLDYRIWRKWAYVFFALTLAGLVAVLIPSIGDRAGGASRWLGFGPVRFQPSEPAKLALILVAADICVRKSRRLATLRDVVLPLGLMGGGACLLVILQPDLGTMLILGFCLSVVLFTAGVPMRLLAGIGAAGTGGAVLLSLTEGYRRARLFSFLNPFDDPLNAGYQVIQSQIALGSGGLFGVGLGESRQKWLYVPNAHTDFIFAIFGEETGLLGTLTVVALFLLLAYAGIRVARRAPDPFGRLVAAGITAWIVAQAFVNMGGVTGMLPITGVPLPLMSFGGSALLFTLAGCGILLNVARQEQWPPRRAAAPSPVAPSAAAPSPAPRRAAPVVRRRGPIGWTGRR